MLTKDRRLVEVHPAQVTWSQAETMILNNQVQTGPENTPRVITISLSSLSGAVMDRLRASKQ